jgi:hypothetical protein
VLVHSKVVHRLASSREEHPAEHDDAEQVPELTEDKSEQLHYRNDKTNKSKW